MNCKDIKFVWIPEAPKYPGLYAPKDYIAVTFTATDSPDKAMTFDSWDQCLEWCEENPYPEFQPKEHGFA